MPLRGVPTHERPDDSPLGRGKGRQALGWVVEQGTDPPRRNATAVAARHPSKEGIFGGGSRNPLSFRPSAARAGIQPGFRPRLTIRRGDLSPE